jgi:hypothetical protein
MQSLSQSIFRMFGVLSVCGSLTLCSELASAQLIQQDTDTQQGTSMSGPTSGEGSPSEAGTVTERSIQQFTPQVGMGMEGQPGANPAPGAAGFKCSAHTGRCNCLGAGDCKYMKDLIGVNCKSMNCSGSGSAQTCTCTITGF